jgi:hypothetical protein
MGANLLARKGSTNRRHSVLDRAAEVTDIRNASGSKTIKGDNAMLDQRISRRSLLAGAAGASALLALPKSAHAQGPAIKKGTSLRLWILKTYVEPTNKAIEARAPRGAPKQGARVRGG